METMHKLAVMSKLHFKMLCHTEKETVASEMVSSAIYFDMCYIVKPYELRDLFNKDSEV